MADITALKDSFVIADTPEKTQKLVANGYSNVMVTNVHGAPVNILVLSSLVEEDYLEKTQEFASWYFETFSSTASAPPVPSVDPTQP